LGHRQGRPMDHASGHNNKKTLDRNSVIERSSTSAAPLWRGRTAAVIFPSHSRRIEAASGAVHPHADSLPRNLHVSRSFGQSNLVRFAVQSQAEFCCRRLIARRIETPARSTVPNIAKAAPLSGTAVNGVSAIPPLYSKR